MTRRWDIGRGCPAVEGGAVSAIRELAMAVNDDGPTPLVSPDGRAVISRTERRVRLYHTGLSGIPMTVTVPLAHFRGVCADIEIGDDALPSGFRLILTHDDPDLEIELFRAVDDADIVAAWRALSRDLGLPMLMRTETGDLSSRDRLGALEVGPVAPRRAPRAFLRRRPKTLRRRKVGVVRPAKGRAVAGTP
jgi:hypothetical protein